MCVCVFPSIEWLLAVCVCVCPRVCVFVCARIPGTPTVLWLHSSRNLDDCTNTHTHIRTPTAVVFLEENSYIDFPQTGTHMHKSRTDTHNTHPASNSQRGSTFADAAHTYTTHTHAYAHRHTDTLITLASTDAYVLNLEPIELKLPFTY